MNSFEWKILLSLTLAGLFLLFLLIVKPKPRNSATNPGFLKWIWNILFPSFPPEHENRSPTAKNMEQKFSPNLSSDKNFNPSISKPNPKAKENPTSLTMEVFDYNGVKILHDNGLWTVNDKGIVRSFKNWENLPPIYQKMVKELDNRSLDQKKSRDYFVEILNGFYYVSLPGGKKKKYNSYSEIPPEIKKHFPHNS